MGSSFFHTRRLGYRQNPFGALTAAAWTAVSFLPAPVAALLETPFTHLQILGPKGIGKSSTLHHLRGWAEKNGGMVAFEYIPEGQRRFHTDFTQLDWFFLDEAQRLTRWERRRWLAGADAGLRHVFSSHRDLSGAFRRRGLELVSVDLTAVVTPAHYAQWLERRLAHFALPDQPRLQPAADAPNWLFNTFGLDMREAEYFLYEVWQRAEEPRVITIAELAEAKVKLKK